MSSPSLPPDAAHARLGALRDGLLHLHKILLDSVAAWYDREVRRVRSRQELLGLVLSDPEFAWLRELSGLIVAVDEARDADEPPGPAEADELVARAFALLSPEESGAGFPRKYFETLQRDPDVVVAHARARRLLESLG